MASYDVNGELIWLPQPEEFLQFKKSVAKCDEKKIPSFKALQNLKKFISHNCGVKFFIQEVKQRNPSRSQSTGCLELSKSDKKKEAQYYHEEMVLHLKGKLEFERDFSFDRASFVDKFCTANKTNSPELWLNFDISLMCEDTSVKTKDYFLELKHFSLGNIIGLNTFVEHFNSYTTIIPTGYKISQVEAKFLHDKKQLLVYFVVGDMRRSGERRTPLTHRLFKLDVSYSSFNRILVNDSDENFSVYFHLLKPPLLYAIIQDEEDERYIKAADITPGTCWIRKVDLFDGCPSYLKAEFGMNFVLKLDFRKKCYDALVPIKSYCKVFDVGITPMRVVPYVKDAMINAPISDFDCYYALQCVCTHSYYILDQLTAWSQLKEMNKFLEKKSVENAPALTEALIHIFKALDNGSIVLFKQDINNLYECLCNCISPTTKNDKTIKVHVAPKSEDGVKKKSTKEKLLLIKKAFFMPTHVRFVPPIPTLKNRALLQCDPSFSLRVAIRDIDMRTLNFTLSQGISSGDVPEKLSTHFLNEVFFNSYIKEPLLKGVKIGKRLYNYVGGSSSQLRSHGVWFYALDNHDPPRTANNIRKSIGDMHKITQVSKFMARMGQTFSQAMGRIDVPQECTNVNNPDKDVVGGTKQYMCVIKKDKKIKFLSEIKEYFKSENLSEDKALEEETEPEPYTFSDGIGRMSEEIANEIYKTLELDEGVCPSAMQIRYAGCKGMLVVDPTIKGKKIFFRESMKKFDSESTSLEILKLSEKSTLYLNRPFITILEQLGVPKKVFLHLQREMIQGHIKAMFYEEDAMNFLHRNALLRLDFQLMFVAGIKFTEDPLFRSMILAIFKRQVDLLKTKARIEIPVNYGRTMLGVMDDTFTLEYGEVFVQYSEWYKNKPVIVKGNITVTKNPCMHPGDVRMFNAVDIPALHHIKDCIVFPAKGHRPHPDEMAGSDLDGDTYSVLWLKEFYFHNEEPMNFAIDTRAKKTSNDKKSKGIEPGKELDHFRQYILNDNVGLFANAHLALADRLPRGIFDETCLKLAEKYSLALDFIKSGIPVSRDFGDVALQYPDFMEKLGEKNTYLSTKTNGYLYRNCKRLEIGLEGTKDTRQFCLDEDLKYDNWEKYEESAKRSFKKYSKKIEYYMQVYNFESEAEILAGIINNISQTHQDKHDFENTLALMENEVNWIFNDFQKDFFKEFGGKPKNGMFTEDMCRKASAWYVVSYTKENDDLHCFGLPWAVADILVYIKKLNSYDLDNLLAQKALKSFIEKIIDHNVAEHMSDVTPETEVAVLYENRMNVLDIAYKILTKWLHRQKEHLFVPSFDACKKYLSAEFDTVTERILSCDVQYVEKLISQNQSKQVLSPGYHVIQTLLQISKIGISHGEIVTDERQELGLFAWITLIKLACTANTQHLGIMDESGVYATSVFYKVPDDVVEVIRLPLFDTRASAGNTDFSMTLIQDEEKVVNYLKEQTRLKYVECRIIPEKNTRYSMLMTVQGTRFAIEKLKDIVVMQDFYKSVTMDKPLTFNFLNDNQSLT